MPAKGIQKIFLSIVLPAILAIGLFILSIFAILIPAFEKTMMERKKEMIHEITTATWSLLEEYNREVKEHTTTLEEAQKQAVSKIEVMRYGEEGKDYFWIIDTRPFMIMHPYRKELNGTDLSDYQDPADKRLFVEAVDIVKAKGEGYIHYLWQWKDDSTRVVPKLSYVKGYPEWGWIIGTGIYLEDVKEEMALLERKLLRISLIITLIISIILLFIVRQSFAIERKRKKAEEKLKLSRLKYQSLVQASVDGTLMIIRDKIIFSNMKFNKMLGLKSTDALALTFHDIFEIPWEQVMSKFKKPGKSVTLETRLKNKSEFLKDVVITVSNIEYAHEEGFIIIIKDITTQRQIEKETTALSEEVQTSLLLMNQPIKHFIKEFTPCSLHSSISEAASLMTRKNQSILFVHEGKNIIGALTDSDLRSRVLAKGIDGSQPVSGIMTAPVLDIGENSLLYEALLLFTQQHVSHLAVKNRTGEMIGVVGKDDLLEMQGNAVGYLLKEIETTENIQDIRRSHEKVPVIVKALLESGAKTRNITRIITSLSDTIALKMITLAIDKLGPPPCRFAFLSLGSEGRMEQTLATDQDNAIVFEDIGDPKREQTAAYFLALADIVNQNLDKAGFNLCKGDVMARNPRWTQPLSEWKTYFSHWINNSDPKSILEISIFFDFRCIYGEESFALELRQEINRLIENKAVFFQHLTQPVLKFKPPVNLFGNIVGEVECNGGECIDIKKIILQIIGFIRIYALQNKLIETHSLERLDQLKSLGVVTKSIHDILEQAYDFLMLIRFKIQANRILNNTEPDNLMEIKNLTDIETITLKRIFTEISELQTKLNFDFKGSL